MISGAFSPTSTLYFLASDGAENEWLGGASQRIFLGQMDAAKQLGDPSWAS